MFHGRTDSEAASILTESTKNSDMNHSGGKKKNSLKKGNGVSRQLVHRIEVDNPPSLLHYGSLISPFRFVNVFPTTAM